MEYLPLRLMLPDITAGTTEESNTFESIKPRLERAARTQETVLCKTVAMESTGSYWQTIFNSLQAAGFDVILVNGSQIKNVKGRKTDVLDCMWIQKLHSLGLLSGSFLLSEGYVART